MCKQHVCQLWITAEIIGWMVKWLVYMNVNMHKIYKIHFLFSYNFFVIKQKIGLGTNCTEG